jgi:hypothetical protein
MPTFYSRQTGQAIPDLSLDQAQKGIIDGSIALAADEAPVAVKSPTGEIKTLPADQVANAIASGQYSLASHHEQLQHQVNEEEKAKGLTGSLVEGARSFGNQLLMGVPGIISDATLSPEEKEKRDLVEQYHSEVRTAGGIAGFAGSMLAGGELGALGKIGEAGNAVKDAILPEEIANAGLAHRAFAKAAQVGTEGALYSTPQAMAQLAVGDPKQAAESLLWGVGGGVALGSGEELLSSLKSGVVGLADKALSSNLVKDKLTDLNRTSTANAIGAQRRNTNKLGMDRTDELLDYAQEKGFVKSGMTREEIGDAIRQAKQDMGSNIGEHIQAADSILRKGTDMVAHGFKPGELGAELFRRMASEDLNMPINAEAKAIVDKIVQSADMIKPEKINDQEVIPFEKVQNFISNTLGKRYGQASRKVMNEGGIRGVETITPADAIKAQAYAYAKDTFERKLDQFAAEAGGPEKADLFGKLSKYKQEYSKLADLENMANNVNAQQAGNKLFSLTGEMHAGNGFASNLTGFAGKAVGGAIGGAIGGAATGDSQGTLTGTLTGALLGAAGAKIPGRLLDLIAKKWLEDKGMPILSNATRTALKSGSSAETFATILGEDATTRLKASMSKVGDTIHAMALRSAAPTSLALEKTGLSHLLDHKHDDKSEAEQLKQLQSRLTTLGTNPYATSQLASAVSAPFQNLSPETAKAYADKFTQSVNYLYQTMPKPPNAPTQLFAPTDTWKPHPNDMQAWRDKIETVANPMSVLNHLHSGTLSQDHINALQTVYPMIHQMMKDNIVKYAMQHPDVKLPVQEQKSVNKFFGIPDPLAPFASNLQAKYGSANQETQSQTSTVPAQNIGKLKSQNIAPATASLQGNNAE